MADGQSHPEDWRADVLASDGGVVFIRPITPDDADKLVAFHGGLSERTRYLRYFEPYPVMSERDVYRATHVDHHHRVCLIAMLGDEIIAVGVYEGEPGEPSAEVAFVVADAHQRRGLSSVLLEHLAAAAAENGIVAFVATVLADNPSMVRVFEEAGYQVRGTDDGDIVYLEFAIDPTESRLQVQHARERASEARSVRNLLSPTSIAVIGASDTEGKVGHAVLANLLRGHFNGPVFPVNDTRRSVQGVRAYSSVREIPDPVDLVVVAVPAADIINVLDDCLVKGVKCLVVLSAGFADADDARGSAAQRRLLLEVRAHGMRLVGPNALGLANTHPSVAMNATVVPDLPGRGRAGFFCQSDALGATILREADRRRIGLSTFVSAGNRADVSGNDLLQYWGDDPETDVVLLYLETLGNPRKFWHIAGRLAREKAIVVVRGTRIDRPDADGDATGIDNAVAANLFHQAGVIAVDSIEDMFDCAALLCHQPLPAGPHVAIISTSGPLAWFAADLAHGGGLVVTRTDVLGPTAEPDELRTALAAAMADPRVDSVVALVIPPIPVSMEPFAAALRDAVRVAPKPIVTTFVGERGIPVALSVNGSDGMPEFGSVPSYPTPDRAVHALLRARRFAQWREEPVSPPRRPDDVDVERAHAVVVRALRTGSGGRLTDPEAAELLGCFGIRVVDFREAGSAEDAVAASEGLGYPVAVKATGEGWRNRPDLRGVRFDLAGEGEVRRAYGEVAGASGSSAVHVQRMAVKGIGCVIEVRDDPSFGPVVSFGLSGMISELLGDRAYRGLPLAPEEAERLVAAPRSAPLLAGTSNTEPADTAALADLLMRVSALCEEIPEIRELALDPILASAGGAEVLDARVRVGFEIPHRDIGPRRIS